MTADLSALEALLARASARARLTRGLAWSSKVVLGMSALILAGRASSLLLGGELRAWLPLADAWGYAALALALAFALGLSWPVSRDELAHQIDHAGALEGRMRAASEFMRLPVAARSGFVAAALRDANARARPELAALAVPALRRRGWSWVLSCLGLVACLLAGWRDPPRRPPLEPVPSPGPALGTASALAADDLAARAEAARALLAQPTKSPPLRHQLADYRTLLAGLTDGSLTQERALQQVLALEARLRGAAAERTREAPGSAGDTRALRALAGELAKAQPALARALESQDHARAASALHALGRSLATRQLPEPERERLRQALARAREREQARAADEARARELEQELREQAETREPSLLKRRDAQQRELGRLRARAAARPQRRLEQLSRELARAGAALAGGRPDEAASALDAAGAALDEQLSEQRDELHAEALARELSQLRELLQRRALSPGPAEAERQAGPAPGDDEAAQEADQRARAARARAEPRADTEARTNESGGGTRSGAGGAHEGPGQRDRETAAETLTLALEDEARARRERFDRHARGALDLPDAGRIARLSPDRGTSTPAATLLLPGAAERRVLVPGVSDVAGGSEHDEQRLSSPTHGDSKLEDRALSGALGAGPTRSQVIRSAAQSGFASARYRHVYGDYRAHAEAALEADQVPAGYRFQVRRYFELVRPREEQDPAP
jgi:hypothetical protein